MSKKIEPPCPKTISRCVKNTLSVVLLLAVILSLAACGTHTGGSALTLATTTSVNDSGLLDYLKPSFEKDTGITLEIVAQGSGQAMETGKNGDADVLLVHSKKAEEEFVSEGYGLKKNGFMDNYFVVAGPKSDPAGLKNASDTENGAAGAMRKIMDSKSPFISRGDDSGTHKKELTLWDKLGVKPSGEWYVSAGKGMGAVLSMASEKQAYTLTDKATYLSMQDKLDLQIVIDAAPDLKNVYSLIAVNPEKHKDINGKGAQEFIKWMTSKNTLDMIGGFGKDKYGESLFTPSFAEQGTL